MIRTVRGLIVAHVRNTRSVSDRYGRNLVQATGATPPARPRACDDTGKKPRGATARCYDGQYWDTAEVKGSAKKRISP